MGDLVAKMVSMAHDKGPHDFRTFIQLAVQSLGADLAERIGPGLEWAWELVRKEADSSGRMTPAKSVAAIVAGMRAGNPSKGRTGTHTQHGRRGGELAARHDAVTDGPRGRSDNRWTGGKAHLVFPTLPPDLRGQSGAVFQSFVFSEDVGQEVALFLLDAPDFARRLGGLKPFRLVAKCGVVETSAGMIAYILWSVSGARGHVVDYEQLLNLFNPKVMDLVAAAASQSRLRVVILDSHSSKAEGFLECENNFGLDEFASVLGQIRRRETPTDFQETRTAFFAEFTLEELKEA